MNKRLNETQITGILKEAEAGTPVPELCRQYGVGNSTFYKWRSKYGGMEASDVKRLKELEEENHRLKQMKVKSDCQVGIHYHLRYPLIIMFAGQWIL